MMNVSTKDPKKVLDGGWIVGRRDRDGMGEEGEREGGARRGRGRGEGGVKW